MHNFNNSSSLAYKQDIKKELKNDDEIRILGVFETTNQVIRKTYDFKVDDQGNAVKQEISEHISGECNCLPPQTESRYGVPQCSGALIFNENFDKTLSNWKHEIRSKIGSNYPIQEFVAYVKYKDNCYLENGNLVLKASWVYGNYTEFKLNECTSKTRGSMSKYKYECGPYKPSAHVPLPPIYTAKVYNDKDKFSFKYGRVEIRARFPIGDWLFPCE